VIRFITGTGTGVGKTVVAAAMARADHRAGRRVAYFKPVQTGADPEDPGDAGFVAAAAGIPVLEGRRFTEPLAPAVAAERAGEKISVDSLVFMAHGEMVAVDVLLVEGAGGLLVPIAGDITMADLAQRIGAEVVIVTNPGLGTLNDTALTLEAARNRLLDLAGLVVDDWPAEPGLVERTNLERLCRMAPVLGVVPHIPGLDITQPVPPDLELELRPASEFRVQ
jgi:dethiobiotin synthetase